MSLTASGAAPADDKIEALVGLVLQAVDQRLGGVRDQIAELANTVARHHADLQLQVDECRSLITSSRVATQPVSDSEGVDSADSAASVALLAAANLLTERVGSLESRLLQYTDEQVTRLEAIIARSVSATPDPVAPKPTATVSPAVAGLGSLTTFTHVSPVLTPTATPISTPVPTVAAAPVAAVAAAVDPVVAAPAVAAPLATVAAPAGPVEANRAVDGFDIDAFSAQLNARLSALVEKAIAT